VNGPIDRAILSVGLKSMSDSTRGCSNVELMDRAGAKTLGKSWTAMVSSVSLSSLSVESSVVTAMEMRLLPSVVVEEVTTGVLVNVPPEPVLENWKRRLRGKVSAVVVGLKAHWVEVGLLPTTFMFLPSPDPCRVQTTAGPPTVAGGPVIVTLCVNNAWDSAVMKAWEPAANGFGA